MKKVLVIYYSQTGQLGDIVNNFCQPFKNDASVDLDIVKFIPEEEFVFPWTGKRFFSVMPDCVLGNERPLKDFTLKHDSYDLIVFGYQPWFLSPSLPAISMLRHPKFIQAAKNTPIVTLIGARNMWLNAQEKVKKELKKHNSPLVGNIALVDKNQNLISVASIAYWMFKGKKERYLGIFPKPGITDEDILKAGSYGEIVLNHLKSDNLGLLQKELVEHEAVFVKRNLMFIEDRGSKVFAIWAKIISRKKNKTLWLKFFKYYLIFALVFIAPIVILLNLLISPLLYRYIRKKRRYYLGLN